MCRSEVRGLGMLGWEGGLEGGYCLFVWYSVGWLVEVKE
jgi:hypothetical protein